MLARVLLLSCAVLLVSCKLMRSSTGEEEAPLPVFGRGDLPRDPPDSCEFLEKVEVTRLEKREVPMDKLERAAREIDGNALAYIRPDGFKDSYLGKEYRFIASVYRCPEPKPSASSSAGAAPSSSAAPIN